eukprot:1108672-Rhodomonas_salina.1
MPRWPDEAIAIEGRIPGVRGQREAAARSPVLLRGWLASVSDIMIAIDSSRPSNRLRQHFESVLRPDSTLTNFDTCPPARLPARLL